uniref:Uncharacterized protein n=1 Tax=Timema shepardi TaxID=629360 RepID=A0A7R9G5S1_TIMSH|nr:unnamed protein product [Timema shepardi]
MTPSSGTLMTRRMPSRQKGQPLAVSPAVIHQPTVQQPLNQRRL